jgi:acetyltransferase-like isoleucine patch superfamily enzyme
MSLSQLTDQLATHFFQHPQALVESDDIGSNSRVWAFAHIMKGARIGQNCNIGEHAYIECGVRLGDNVTVKNGVALWNGVSVEDEVFLGPYCVFTNDPNPRAYIKKGADALLPTLVRANATIGANATILCGVTIGRYAFVGAGAVVLRSVPDFGLIVGNPGRQIGWMCLCAHKLQLPITAPSGAICRCASCRSIFRKDNQTLTLQVPQTVASSK